MNSGHLTLPIKDELGSREEVLDGLVNAELSSECCGVMSVADICGSRIY